MFLINKIKYQYNTKILQDFISNKDFHKFFDHIEKSKHDKKLYIQLLFSLANPIMLENEDDIFNQKIIWINSFIKDDSNYISRFINYYFKKIQKEGELIQYENEIISILNEFQDVKEIKFNDFVNYSYLYQYLIINKNKNAIKLINNHMPFFSTPNNMNFSKHTLTRAYFFIIDHPYRVYQIIKNNNNGDQNIARNIFLNLDDHSEILNINNTEIEINKKGWHTHTNSWTDANVLNSLNGKVILKKNIYSDTYDVLSSIILHIIQSGLKIDINYKIIEDFINEMPPKDETIELNLSHKEKKFIDQYIDGIISSYNFDSI